MTKIVTRVLLAAVGLCGLYFGYLYWTRPVLPRTLRIAAGHPGGLYYQFARELAPFLRRSTGRDVAVIETNGAEENAELLRRGQVNIAILQTCPHPPVGDTNTPTETGGNTSTASTYYQQKFAQVGARSDDVASCESVAVTPLFLELAYVIVPGDAPHADINEIDRLRGNVSIGPPHSGTRAVATAILDHYRIDPTAIIPRENYMRDLARDSLSDGGANYKLDAAIVVGGLLNPDVQELLATRAYRILPVTDAEALSLRYPCFRPAQIPHGFFAENPAVPESAATSTIAVTGYLAVGDKAPTSLVGGLLDALYENESSLRQRFPTLIPKSVAMDSPIQLHPQAVRYLDPFGGINRVTEVLQGLDSLKNLLLAVCLVLLFVWGRVKARKERIRVREAATQKERLDLLLMDMMRIDEEQARSNDPAHLTESLGALGAIKLKALRELTDEKLRGDRVFSIFLMTCGELMRSIQTKLLMLGLQSTREQLDGANGGKQI